jgi:hypothetical protein
MMSNGKHLWNKLQDLSCKHGSHLYRSKQGLSPMPPRGSGSFIVTDQDHRDTVSILGRGDENEMACRIHWYLDNFPSFFDGSTHKEKQSA